MSVRPQSVSLSAPPHIPPPPAGTGPRPFWSVMIPVYNAKHHYLEETLRSLLAQDPGPEQMQIEVVDDCSPDGAPVELIRRIAGDRVTLHREPKNLGIAGIWNRCIERARGEWVHILHQDDVVQPGFYAALRRGIETCPQAGAAFTRHATINPSGHWMALSELERETAGVLENWREKIAVRQRIQCAAIVVRRSTYEDIGGCLPELCFTLDWEMWQRLAARYPVWFEPGILACYRLHSSSETSRLTLEAADTRDIEAMINLTKSYHPPELCGQLVRQARQYYALFAMSKARQLLVAGHAKAARRQAAGALRLSPSWPVLYQVMSLGLLHAKLAGARIKRALRGQAASK